MRRMLLWSMFSVGCADKVVGEISIGDTDVFAPFDCSNGEQFGFAGVEMWDDEGRRAQFGQFGGEAAFVLLTEDDIESLRLDSQACVDFSGDMRRTMRGYRKGFITVECDLGSGSIEGSLTFRRCGLE